MSLALVNMMLEEIILCSKTLATLATMVILGFLVFPFLMVLQYPLFAKRFFTPLAFVYLFMCALLMLSQYTTFAKIFLTLSALVGNFLLLVPYKMPVVREEPPTAITLVTIVVCALLMLPQDPL